MQKFSSNQMPGTMFIVYCTYLRILDHFLSFTDVTSLFPLIRHQSHESGVLSRFTSGMLKWEVLSLLGWFTPRMSK